MEIADEPAKPGALDGSAEGYLEDRLGLLGNDIDGALGIEEGRVIGERFDKVESEFAAILRGAAPAAFFKGVPVDREENLDDAMVGIG